MTTTYEHKTELVGDDYTGLPTRPVPYRSKPKQTGLLWDQITEQYVAGGGQVDASVWPGHNGKVVIVGGSANSSRANLHTFVEGDDYDEPESTPAQKRAVRAAVQRQAPRPVRPKRTPTAAKPRTDIKITPEMRPEIARRYRAGETIPGLAKAYGVATGSIQFALRKENVRLRNRQEAGQLRRERRAS